MDAKSWYTIDNVETLDSPCLVIYPDRVKENIDIVKGMIEDVNRLRPHVKTHKTKEIILLLLEAGIRKFKCATIAEAEMLGMCLAPDVLLAYQPIGPKLSRFIKLIEQYPDTQYSCLVDNQYAAKKISETALKHGLVVTVFIDLNVGMNRTGISPGTEALQLYTDCSSLKGIKPIGLHAYDGHNHGSSLNVRTQEFNGYFNHVLDLQQEITKKGYPEPLIVAGGTPTFPMLVRQKNIQCSPGTFILWDKGYQDAYEEQKFLPAALLIARIISLPDKNKICIDLGYKSVAAENNLGHRIFFLNAPELKPVSQSEEHLVLDAGSGHNYKVGDILYGLPIHICPTCALYEKAIIIENREITGEWKILSRDRKITI
jgi:D-serine deaminase-like pyridoxal phosphate-dependent protein